MTSHSTVYLIYIHSGVEGDGENGTYCRRALELRADTFFGNLQFAALGDLDRLGRLVAGLGLGVLDLLHNFVALEDLAEDDVTAIEPTVTIYISMTFSRRRRYCRELLTR